MNIGEAIELKEDLESKMALMIDEFEENTSLKVKNVLFSSHAQGENFIELIIPLE